MVDLRFFENPNERSAGLLVVHSVREVEVLLDPEIRVAVHAAINGVNFILLSVNHFPSCIYRSSKNREEFFFDLIVGPGRCFVYYIIRFYLSKDVPF